MYPTFSNFRTLSQRLRSFEGWFGCPNPRSLAIAGFFHVSGESDAVQCFYCGVVVHKWEPNDDPIIEHLRWSRNCWFADTIKYVRDSERFLKSTSKISQDEVDSQCRREPEIGELLLRIIKYVFYT